MCLECSSNEYAIDPDSGNCVKCDENCSICINTDQEFPDQSDLITNMGLSFLKCLQCLPGFTISLNGKNC